MPALQLLVRLIVYYAVLAGLVALLLWAFPSVEHFLPVGRVQGLIADAGGPLAKQQAGLRIGHAATFGGSLIWLVSAVLGALLTALPVCWTYQAVRNPEDYDQSLIGTILILPLVVTSIVIIVQDSLALSFSLAGIAGAARFRNSMKSSGDLLFVLLSIATGLAAGIGAMELALVTTAIFNLAFVALWFTEFGERREMKRYLGDFRPDPIEPGDTVVTSVTEVVEQVTVATRPHKQ